MEKLVSIILVNYKKNYFTIDCLKSLLHQTYRNFEIIIIDNGSEYNSFLELKKELIKFESDIDIKLIRSDLNLYFASGNNKAIKLAKGDYICLLNYDTVVLPDFIEKMIEFLEKREDAGMISPKIKVYEYKNYLWYAGGELSFKNAILVSLRGYWEYDPQDKKYNEISITDFAAGTSLFLKREIIDKIGFMDEIFFMYQEDPDWSFRAKKEGYKNYYVPTTIVYHKIPPVLDKRRLLLHNYFVNRNSQIFVWKHAKLKEFMIFYIKYIFKNLKEFNLYLYTAIQQKRVFIVLLQFFSILQGFRIGLKRRTNRSCKKNLIRDYNFIVNIQKKIQLLKNFK